MSKIAPVIQVIKTAKHRHFEPAVVSADWHGVITFTVGPRTICGIQLEGEDGYGAGPQKTGAVTCPLCQGIIDEIRNYL